MYRMLTFSIVFLLLLLPSVENFKLTKNQILSHLRKQPSPSNPSTSITHEMHTCLFGCFVTLSFNDSLVLPDDCHTVETNDTCEMTAIIDYESQEFLLYSFRNPESLTIDNITYASIAEHFVHFTFDDKTIFHTLDYGCAAGDNCEWEYMKQIIPKLILLDYQPLYNLLLPKIFNSDGNPGPTQCYNNTELVNCSSSMCQYHQILNDKYELESIRECSIFDDSWVEIGSERHFPGPARHDYDIVGFACNIDQCNDQSNEDEIKQIISLNGNEYITSKSSGTKVQWTSFILFFLSFISIKYFK